MNAPRHPDQRPAGRDRWLIAAITVGGLTALVVLAEGAWLLWAVLRSLSK